MKKKKAFTLAELLAVIVILAIILLIAVPSVLKIIEKSKNDSYLQNIEMIRSSAMKYMTSKLDTYIFDGNNKLEISLKDLIDDKMFTEVKDPRCNGIFSPNDTKIIITKKDDYLEYEVIPVTECYNDTIPPTLNGVDDITIKLNSSFDLLNGVEAIDESGIEGNIEVNPNTIDTSILGEQIFTYTVKDKNGNITTKIRKVTIIEYLVDAVNPGDFISYDIEPWSQTVARPSSQGTFGGYNANTSKNTSITCYNSYINKYNGWRVLEKQGSGIDGKVILIHAGTPECYYHQVGSAIASQTVLNKSDKGSDVYNKYVNENYADNAKYFNCDFASSVFNYSCNSPVLINDNDLLITGAIWYLGTAANNYNLYHANNSHIASVNGSTDTNTKFIYGVRPTVTLKSGLIKINGDGSETNPYIMSK